MRQHKYCMHSIKKKKIGACREEKKKKRACQQVTSAPRDLLLQGPDAFISCRSRAAARPPASPIALHGSGGASALGGGPAAPHSAPQSTAGCGRRGCFCPPTPPSFWALGRYEGQVVGRQFFGVGEKHPSLSLWWGCSGSSKERLWCPLKGGALGLGAHCDSLNVKQGPAAPGGAVALCVQSGLPTGIPCGSGDSSDRREESQLGALLQLSTQIGVWGGQGSPSSAPSFTQYDPCPICILLD